MEDHLVSNNLLKEHQSEYRKFHSTEPAVVKELSEYGLKVKKDKC